MAYDIYGDLLERGHCEVHPWVPEEYPCRECQRDEERRQHYVNMEREYLEALECAHKEFLEKQELEYLYNSTFLYFLDQDAGTANERGGEE